MIGKEIIVLYVLFFLLLVSVIVVGVHNRPSADFKDVNFKENDQPGNPKPGDVRTF